jgi:transcriptional regulator with XRE-family HTH domain
VSPALRVGPFASIRLFSGAIRSCKCSRCAVVSEYVLHSLTEQLYKSRYLWKEILPPENGVEQGMWFWYIRSVKRPQKSESTPRKKRERQHFRRDSLGALAREFYEGGWPAFRGVLDYAEISQKPWLLHLREGKPIARNETGVDDTVTYFGFDPPPEWENPFQVMKVLVDSGQATKYLSHPGEEYLLPIDGSGVEYGFYWADEGSGHLPYPVIERLECQVISIAAEIPHTAKRLGAPPTNCWMITRPMQESAPVIYHLDKEKENALVDESSVQGDPALSTDRDPDWSDPAIFALRAWGISEQLKFQRAKNKLTIKRAADRAKIDRSQLSKIEDATPGADPSLTTLRKVADVLDLDIADLLSPPTEKCWISSPIDFATSKPGREPLFDQNARQKIWERKAGGDGGSRRSALKKPYADHFVHLQKWTFPSDQKKHFVSEREIKELGDLRWSSAWIVYEGLATITIEFGDEVVDVAVLPGSVLHIRGGGPRITKIDPAKDTVILQINYSRDPDKCNCRK